MAENKGLQLNDERPASSGGEARPGLSGRQPIVVVMGHVDHGKTTLLDYIRKMTFGAQAAPEGGEPRSVAEREAGGITQAVGAYEIEHAGKKITFIDTPGHEAFSKMRERGANAADLAILVVAAEEGVKSQTKEVIKTLEATKTPFVVAINKIDKAGVDIEKTKNDLMANGVYLEGYGGQTSFEPISAKTGENVDKLLDLVLLLAETEELKADASAPAKGYILETRLNKNRGIEASAILTGGTLKRGDDVATTTAKGRVKILENFLGKPADTISAGAPCLIVGFEEAPQIGEELFSGGDAEANHKKSIVSGKSSPPAGGLAVVEGGKEYFTLLLKASDAGSLEALSGIVRALPLRKPVQVVDESVGEIGEGDVKMAISSGATIIGFKTKTDRAAKNLAETQEVEIISSEIIYELVKAIEELAKEVEQGRIIGELDVLAVFNSTKLDKQLVGGKTISGIFKNKVQAEIHRAGVKVGDGRIGNLQTKKQDAVSIPEGQEGGVLIGSSILIEKGDHLIIREKKV